MEFTGERVIPGQVDLDLWNEHVARYAFAARVASRMEMRDGPLRVLDAGCGSGYGAAYLACWNPALEVLGLDISEEALQYARDRYAAANLRYQRGDCLALGFPENSFDLVVAFEVIEHLASPEVFLEQARRILAPGGVLLVSTPNRRYYTEERRFENPFHAREYDPAEFDALLQPCFPERALFTQNHAAAISFFPCRAGQAGEAIGAGAQFLREPERNDQPHFVMAMCSAAKLAFPEPFVFVPSAGNVLREREHHIARIEEDFHRELETRKRWAEEQAHEVEKRAEIIRRLQAEHEQTAAWGKNLEQDLQQAREIIEARQKELDERTAWATGLNREHERLAGIVKELQAEIESKVAWARSLEADLEKAREALAALQKEFEERTAWALSLQGDMKRLEETIAERTAWAQKLDAELQAARAELRLLLGSLWYRVGKNLRLSPVPPSDQRQESGE